MANKGDTGRTAESTIFRSSIGFDCGGRCPLKVHVEDGMIIRIEGDDGDTEQQLRACLGCRAYRQVVYASDRIKYPIKRVGERGEGRFERISWPEGCKRLPEN